MIIAKIKGLKNIQPDKQWLAFSRSEMQKKMADSNGLEAVSVSSQGFYSLLKFFGQPAVAVLSVVMLLAGSGFVTVKAAQNSLPGNSLYGLKIVLERAEVKLTANEFEKAKLEAEITGRRAQELTDIANLPSFSKESKESQVAKAMNQIDQQLASAKANLPGLKDKIQNNSDGNSQEATDAVKSVQETTDKLKAAIAQAQKIPELSENKALSAMISDISDKLNKADIEISEIQEIIDAISEAQGDVEKVDAGSDTNSTTSPVVVP